MRRHLTRYTLRACVGRGGCVGGVWVCGWDVGVWVECAQFISTELTLLVVVAFNGGLTRKGTPSGRPLRVEAIIPAHKVILLMHTHTLTHV